MFEIFSSFKYQLNFEMTPFRGKDTTAGNDIFDVSKFMGHIHQIADSHSP